MINNRKSQVYKLTIGGLLLAVGIIISRLFHMFATPGLGMMFLPMHIGVFIAGLYLGPYYGTLIGLLTPLINSLFGAPIFPFNIIMAMELAAYGLFAGLFTYILKRYFKN
ncbi:MAG: ECF transporter S component [Clostridiales bacterium]|nr:ECF transporter S component [Clostridiales bacterium]